MIWLLFLIAYIIGSLSPGYFFSRVVKGIDIRKHGDFNTGATNVYRVVGPGYGVMTASFDFFKPILVYWLAIRYFGMGPTLAIVPGLFVVIGHVWPFYLNFRGGKGAASLLGLAIAVIISDRNWVTLGFVSAAGIYMLYLSRRLQGLWSIRKTLKLGALILPFGFIQISAKAFLAITGALLAAAMVFDVVRSLSPKINRWYLARGQFAKQKERRRLSGYTLFLLSAFTLFYLFPKDITLVAITFFIIADLAGPIGGRLMLHKEITHSKTWGGAILIFILCVIAGYFMTNLSPVAVSWRLIVVGSLSVSVLDQLSFLLDDNLLVPLGTATLALLFR